MVDFVKKNWQFRDIISENELNRMEDGIEEGITKAEQAQQTADDAVTAAANAQSDIDEYKNELTSLGIGFDINPPRVADDLNNEISIGWVRFETGETLNRPSDEISDFPHSGVVRVDRRHVNRLVQTAYGVAGNTNVRIAVRALGSAGWGDWVEILHTENTTNIVNQEYEVGSWTPELRFGGSTSGISYASRAGRYIRIANVVYWSFSITLSSKGSASGNVEIAGMPFVGEPVFGHHHHSIGRAINIAEPKWLFGSIITGSIFLYTNDGSPFTSTGFANNSILQASGFYSI